MSCCRNGAIALWRRQRQRWPPPPKPTAAATAPKMASPSRPPGTPAPAAGVCLDPSGGLRRPHAPACDPGAGVTYLPPGAAHRQRRTLPGAPDGAPSRHRSRPGGPAPQGQGQGGQQETGAKVRQITVRSITENRREKIFPYRTITAFSFLLDDEHLFLQCTVFI